MNERIVTAAHLFNIGNEEVIVPCVRHYDHICHMLLFKMGVDERQQGEQGFVTNRGRFVGREEAMRIAAQEGQLLREYNDNCLYSENLY